MRMCCSLPVALSVAETFRMPFRVDVEGDLDLRDAARGRSDAVQVEDTDLLVVLGHRALALQDADLDGRLVVGRRGEDLGLAGRDRGVRVDELGHHAAEGLDTQGKRGDIQQEDVLVVEFAGEDAALDGGADRDDLVRVHALVGLLAEEVLHELLHVRDTGGTAHEEDLVNVRRAQVRIGQGLAARLDGALEQVVGELLELRAGEGLHQVLGDAVHRHDVREVDLRGGLAGEFDLRLLRGFLQTLEGHRVLLQRTRRRASR